MTIIAGAGTTEAAATAMPVDVVAVAVMLTPAPITVAGMVADIGVVATMVAVITAVDIAADR